MSQGEISVGELTSLLMYMVYIRNGLQMLTYGSPCSHSYVDHSL